ncbi:MAG: putative phage protein [Frankiales bacterium]|nr:putative phage protein [Frankiales bacterium]
MSAPVQQQLTADPDVTRTWIETLFGHASDCYLAVSAGFGGKLANRYYPVSTEGIEAAVRQVMAWDKESPSPQGIYLQSTLLRTPPPRGKRGGEAAVHAITHLWADGDYGTVGHKPGLDDLPHPSAAETVMKIVAASPLPEPTGWGWSGGGGNPIWMLSEPHIIADDDDRARLKALTMGWQKIIGAAAYRLGFTWDVEVGNLDRLMKAIGTVNRKADCPERPTAIGAAGGAIYDLAELAEIAARLLPEAEETLAQAARERQARRNKRLGITPPPPRPDRPRTPRPTGTEGPLDVLAEAFSPRDLLEAEGFTYQGQHGDGRMQFLRPTADGDRPSSAYSVLADDHVVVNFSERSGLPVGAQPPGGKLTVGTLYAHFNYGGNRSEAAQDIMRAAGGHQAGPAARLPQQVLAEVKRRCLKDSARGDAENLQAAPADDPWDGPQDEPPEAPDDTPTEPTDRLPDTFWNATPTLQQIRQMARARRTSPDAVLHAVLARVAAMADPTVRADNGIHQPATLGWYCGLFGPSGSGKGQAENTAEELTPFPAIDLAYIDISTGQGLIAAYLDLDIDPDDGDGKKKILVQKRTRGYALATEGSVLDAMAQMSAAATLNGVLCKAWMSERQGTSNAEVERRRALPKGAYTLSMSLGVQEEPAAKLLEMGSIGLPQRLAWAHATLGPDTPKQRPATTGPVTVTTRSGEDIPVTTWVSTLRNCTIPVPAHVTQELDELALEISFGRGSESPLDTHEPLWRVKCAALLALLHGRTSVATEDWDMATVMWQTSRKVRDTVQDAAKRRMRAEQDARRAEAVLTAVESQAAVYEVVNGVHPSVVNVAKRAYRYLIRKGEEVSARDVNRASVAAKDRDKYRASGAMDSLWTAALRYGCEQGWLVPLAEGALLAAGSVNPEQM